MIDNKIKVLLTDEQINLLKTGNYITFANGEEYFNLPFWLKRNKEDNEGFEIVDFWELPKQVKDMYIGKVKIIGEVSQELKDMANKLNIELIYE